MLRRRMFVEISSAQSGRDCVMIDSRYIFSACKAKFCILIAHKNTHKCGGKSPETKSRDNLECTEPKARRS